MIYAYSMTLMMRVHTDTTGIQSTINKQLFCLLIIQVVYISLFQRKPILLLRIRYIYFEDLLTTEVFRI